MEHHLTGLRYMGRLARGTISGTTTVAADRLQIGLDPRISSVNPN
jgi:hypothetical protein